MTLLVWLCGALTGLLALYALGHLACVAVVVLRPLRPVVPPTPSTTPVAVVVPCRNEGAAAVRVLRSLVAQDHAGPVQITLVLADRQDSAVPLLAQAWPHPEWSGTAQVLTLSDDPRRRVQVAFSGVESKSDKINWLVPRIDAPLTAILDCDHVAQPDWLRSAAGVLQAQGARVVQGRRRPLETPGFTALWDSLHQHVGCELFNTAFSSVGLTVFFTGTTAVIETALLRAHPLSACITEDVNFSYEILQEGVTIAHDPASGSREECSPDLYSFLARRRRWANGHTEAFLRQAGGVLGAPLGWRTRAQFLFHGSHYLVCVGVFALHLVIGLLFLERLSWSGGLAAVVASGVLADWIARTQASPRWTTRLSEVAVLFGWVLPAIVIGMTLAVGWLLGDLSHARLPLPGALQVGGLVGLSAPVVVLLVGLWRFRQLSVGTGLAVVLSYPVAFYLDLSGVLLGIVDCVAARRHWHPVTRNTVLAAPEAPVLDPAVRHEFLASWRLEPLVRRAPRVLFDGLRGLLRPGRFVPATLVFGISCSGVLYGPESRVPVVETACRVLPHDGEPWIVPAERRDGYCAQPASPEARWSTRTGSLEAVRQDPLTPVDAAYWDKLDTTFFCNDAVFDPANVRALDGGGVHLALEARPSGDRLYSSASIATKSDRHLYGRFEAELRPARASGVITAFFLYRFDPWQEIDFEFLGRDTTQALINVFYNPGVEGDLYNYGLRGTPVLVDLGFDAADDFHTYAIEWEPGEIRWFADDRLIHRRLTGEPTPVPHLPMRFHVNVWPICSEELAGPMDPAALPTGVDVRRVAFSEWTPPPKSGLPAFLGRVFDEPGADRDWRDDASWMQPGR